MNTATTLPRLQDAPAIGGVSMGCSPHTPRLVKGPELLAIIWPNEATRPTARWLRKMQNQQRIPFLKIGGMVWFDVDQVVKAVRKCTVEAKYEL